MNPKRGGGIPPSLLNMVSTQTPSRDLMPVLDSLPSGTAFIRPSPEISFTPANDVLIDEIKNRRRVSLHWKGAFLYSLLIHLLVGFTLIAGLYSPDRRTIKTVNHWIVNLVSDLQAAPKGLKEGTSETLTSISKKNQPPHPLEPNEEEKALPLSETSPETPPNNEASAEEKVTERETEKAPAILEETVKPGEDTTSVLREPTDQKIQMGQFAWSMPINEQMNSLKIQYFLRNFKEQLRGLIRISLGEEALVDFQGKTASLTLHYPLGDNSENIMTAPDSDMEWAHTLQGKIKWASLTSPHAFGLPHKILRLKVGLKDRNEILVTAELL